MNINGLIGWVAVNVARMGGVRSVTEVVAVGLAVVVDAITDGSRGAVLETDSGAASQDLAERSAGLAGGVDLAAALVVEDLAAVEGADLADLTIIPGTQESAGLGGGASGCLTLAICS
jgi:hypothetical protein